MNAHVWTRMALASALLVWGMSGQAQTSSAGMGAGQGAATPQTRPAPVSGKVGNDPAAVALRPATAAPLTSKATQVAPPANPNEPLFSPAAETPARVAPASTAPATPKPAEAAAQQRKPHTDRTEGVKKQSKTAPQAHEQKVRGKPRHAGSKAAGKNAVPDEAAKDAHHKGKKKGDKHAAASRVKTTAKAHDQAQPQVASSHAGKSVGKHAVAAKQHAKPSRAQAPSASALATTGKHASPAHAAPKDTKAHKGQHGAATKASAPLAKRSGKAARNHKAA